MVIIELLVVIALRAMFTVISSKLGINKNTTSSSGIANYRTNATSSNYATFSVNSTNYGAINIAKTSKYAVFSCFTFKIGVKLFHELAVKSY